MAVRPPQAVYDCSVVLPATVACSLVAAATDAHKRRRVRSGPQSEVDLSMTNALIHGQQALRREVVLVRAADYLRLVSNIQSWTSTYLRRLTSASTIPLSSWPVRLNVRFTVPVRQAPRVLHR